MNQYCNFTFEPPKLEKFVRSSSEVNISRECSGNVELMCKYKVQSRLPSIATVLLDGNETFQGTQLNEFTTIRLLGQQVGRSFLDIQTEADNQSCMDYVHAQSYEIVVVPPTSNLASFFFPILVALLFVFNFGFGCSIEPRSILMIIKKPVAPAVGLFCQFCLMAPIAIAVTQILSMDPVTGFGLLTIGSCPGGGGSNMFALLLDADLELSITMTTISLFVGVVITPFWIWSLGRVFTRSNPHVKIPVKNSMLTLSFIIIPTTLGMLLSHYKPHWTKHLKKIMKPLTLILAVLFLCVTIERYLPTLKLFDYKVLFGCLLVSGVGYLLGFLIAFKVTKDYKKAITISLETGMQNLTMAILMLSISLPSPEAELAGVIPVWYSLLNTFYPLVALIIKTLRYIYHLNHQQKEHESRDLKYNELNHIIISQSDDEKN